MSSPAEKPSATKTAGFEKITGMIRALYSVIHVPTPEEDRLVREITEWARGDSEEGGSPPHYRIYSWTSTDGLVLEEPRDRQRGGGEGGGSEDPLEALNQVMKTPLKNSDIYIFRDLHPYLDNHNTSPQIVRRIRDIAHRFRQSRSVLILTAPSLEVPPDLEKDIAVAEFPLPTPEEIARLVDQSSREAQQAGGEPVRSNAAFSSETREAVIRACQGLTSVEVSDALARAFIEADGEESLIRSINETKQAVIRKSRCLEAHPDLVGMESVGGLDRLKKWVEMRERIFTDEARRYGLDYPKGLLTMGVPGGGKGISARAVASSWGLPLLRLDLGAVFDGLVGGSEENLREALRIAEAVAPCVLWVDEVEKGVSGVGSSGQSDGGTAARVFGTLLTWLQEKEKPVFCYFTANDISAIPPELTRKGRIDEIFFIDLPTNEERREILGIHLRKKGREPDSGRFDLDRLVAETSGLVGAEIEQLINDGMVRAFSQDEEVETKHLLEARQRMVPLVETQRETIEELREFTRAGRAMRASSGGEVTLPDARRNPSAPADFAPPIPVDFG